MKDLILGIGEVSNPVYRVEEAKLWMIFNAHKFEVIDHLEGDPPSKYGTYSNDNNFYTVQKVSQERLSPEREKKLISKKHSEKIRRQVDCPAQNELTLQLRSYNYNLYGRKGDDTFYLGPQTSHVTGGEDNNIFFIMRKIALPP